MAYRNMHFSTSKKGLYIILDMRTFTDADLKRLDFLLSEQVLAVQIWDKELPPNKALLTAIIDTVHRHAIPILINNHYELLVDYDFDGVHFDDIPIHWVDLKAQLKDKIIGITCTNAFEIVDWAAENKIDYLSFCSMFPSENNSRCVLVDREILKKMQEDFAIPFFLAGGIKVHNIKDLEGLNYAGVAIVSGLMSSENPKEIVNEYYQLLNSES